MSRYSAASAAGSFATFSRFGRGPLVGLAPSVRISEMRSTVIPGEQSVVRAHADIKAGMPGGAALTRNDVAGNHDFPAERLDAEALALGIASVAR